MNKRICFIGAVLWGILVISVSTGTVRAGSQALRCEGNNACLNNTGTVAFGSCNGPKPAQGTLRLLRRTPATRTKHALTTAAR
jgi:hypothetical protein